jgi:hypothetical protein
MKEADIIISGERLTESQSMTVRVAIGQFTMFLVDEGCGSDAHGKAMTKNYLARIHEIERLIQKTAS